jgi:hypothetical protein
MHKLKVRVVVTAVVVFTVAATGAGWKWCGAGHGAKHGANQPYGVAGWTWDAPADSPDGV